MTTPRPSTYAGEVNDSHYIRRQLSTDLGTLFRAHLKNDTKIIWDEHGHLARVVEDMGRSTPAASSNVP